MKTPTSIAKVIVIADVNNVLAVAQNAQADKSFRMDWNTMIEATREAFSEVKDIQFTAVLCAENGTVFPPKSRLGWKVVERHRSEVSGAEEQVDETISVLIVQAAVNHRVAWEAGTVNGGLAIVLLSGDRDLCPAVRSALNQGSQVRVWSWLSGLAAEYRITVNDSRFQFGLMDSLSNILRYSPGRASTGTFTARETAAIRDALAQPAAHPCLPDVSTHDEASRLPEVMPLMCNSYLMETAKQWSASQLGLKDTTSDPRIRLVWRNLVKYLRSVDRMDADWRAEWNGCLFAVCAAEVIGCMDGYGLKQRLYPKAENGNHKEIRGAMCVTMVEAALLAHHAHRGITFQLVFPSAAMFPAVRYAQAYGARVRVFGWKGTIAQELYEVADVHDLGRVPDLITREPRSSFTHAQGGVALVLRFPKSLVAAMSADARRQLVDDKLFAARVPYVFFTSEFADHQVAVEFPFCCETLDEPLALTRSAMGADCQVMSWPEYQLRRTRKTPEGSAARAAQRLYMALSSPEHSESSDEDSKEETPGMDSGYSLVVQKRTRRRGSSSSRRCVHRWRCHAGHTCQDFHTEQEHQLFDTFRVQQRSVLKTEKCKWGSMCTRDVCGYAHGPDDSYCHVCGWGHVFAECRHSTSSRSPKHY